MTDQIYVFDDIIPEFLYYSAINEIPKIPMYFGHRGQGYDFGFHFWSNQWNNNDEPWPFKSIWAAFESKKHLLGNVGDIELLRCQLNVTTSQCFGGIHVDVGPGVPYYTMVHFLTGDSGMEFYKDDNVIKTVDYKDNRCVIFPSEIRHQGLPPKESEPRVTVGYVFGGRGTDMTRQKNIGLPIWKEEQNQIFQ